MLFTALQAQIYKNPKPPEHALTKKQVRRFLKTEIVVDKLQMQIKAHRGAYKTLERGEIKIFYKKRAEILKSRGYDPDEYDKIRERVFRAEANIKAYERYKKEHAQHQKMVRNEGYEKQEQSMKEGLSDMIQQIKESEYIPEDKKQQFIAQIKEKQGRVQGSGQKMKQIDQTTDARRYKSITRNKIDWSAVEPYLEELERLADWYNGNGEAPPDIR